MSLRKPEKEDVSAWSKMLAYPASSPLVHVDRDFKSMSIGMYSGKRPAAQRATEYGSDTEEDEAGANDDPVEQARKFGRKKRMEEDGARWQRASDVEAERKRIVNKYYKQGKSSITEQEEQWFNASGFDKNLDDAVSEAVLSKYNKDVLRIMDRLPPANRGDLVPLKYWEMAVIGKTILETTAQMCAAIVAQFTQRGLDPISHARTHTASIRTDIDFNLQTALPAAMSVPSFTIPFMTVQVYARTTPSEAEKQFKARSKDPYSAITWSILFNPRNSQADNRIRDEVNWGLVSQSNRAGPSSDASQITIETLNALNSALNGLWDGLLKTAYEVYAHEWKFQVPALPRAEFRVLPSRPAQQPPSQPAPQQPSSGVVHGQWRTKKRLEKQQ